MFAKTDFKPTPERFAFAEEEEATLNYWKQNETFKKQLQLTKHLPPYTFYDGPPFATGTPHYGHIAAGTIKDVVCRYASQTGHYVTRRFGWDCHGLPVEYEIDKELKITSKTQVIEMGVEKYNKHCRDIVMKYSNQWEEIVGRFGRWIDFKNDYKTMDLTFMESVWYVFQQIYNKGLVYRGRKIMPYSNACNTVLSNFQVQLNYKDTSDPSVFINFPMAEDPTVKFLVWTTTPWTLPSNLALAVNPDFVYVKVKDLKRNEIFILAQLRLKDFYGKDGFQVLEKIKGSDLAGIEYVPLFDFFLERAKDGCFKVETASFVTSDAGTGIVHCAPGFGQQDYKMCVEKKIIHVDNPVVPLDENGCFTKDVPPYQGQYVKDADKNILKDLKANGRLVQSGNIVHSYPFCWRSDTPLIYKAVSTWFIKVTDIKEDLVLNNQKAYWVPKVIQEKKFDNWLKDAKDWCFSRNRFWGNPIPLWVSEDGEEIVCVGSLKELEELTGAKVTDLHRESIDHLTIESKKGKGKLRRIEQVFDCWFESGSMPFAQVHYPFSITDEQFMKIFPADFIGEGIDQTRGWFYTLNIISTCMKNLNPYKNLIVNGLVLTQAGKKMSKRLKNYTDPVIVAREFGADAIRLYLINSPLVRADNLNFSDEGVRDVVRDIFLPWYNAYRFLIQNISKWQSKAGTPFVFSENMLQLSSRFNVTDRWIQSALQILIKNVRKEMNEYKLYNVVPQLIKFLGQLTNWYVRLNRQRLKGEIDEENMVFSLNILFDVLLQTNILMSPHVPFITEHMYQNMRLVIRQQSPLHKQSIHHLLIPQVESKLIDDVCTQGMASMTSIIETARKLREQKKISLKQPIMSLTIVNSSQAMFDNLKPFLHYIEEEINVAEVKNQTNTFKYVKLEALPNLPILGPKFKGNKTFGEVKTAITQLTTEQLLNCKKEGKIVLAENELNAEDLIIKEKFIEGNIQEYEAIGGQGNIVVLDIRQNEQLRLRGFAREIINRIQKLKKKAHIHTEDSVIIFYKFGDKANNIKEAFLKEQASISASVKKPMHEFNKCFGLLELAHDEGLIEEEEYTLKITPAGPIFNFAQLEKCFGNPNHTTLARCLLSIPYEKVRHEKSIKIKLDTVDYLLQEGKHYTAV